jgi:hypothetical protein
VYLSTAARKRLAVKLGEVVVTTVNADLLLRYSGTKSDSGSTRCSCGVQFNLVITRNITFRKSA